MGLVYPVVAAKVVGEMEKGCTVCSFWKWFGDVVGSDDCGEAGRGVSFKNPPNDVFKASLFTEGFIACDS